jgi:hypothetical protein
MVLLLMVLLNGGDDGRLKVDVDQGQKVRVHGSRATRFTRKALMEPSQAPLELNCWTRSPALDSARRILQRRDEIWLVVDNRVKGRFSSRMHLSRISRL